MSTPTTTTGTGTPDALFSPGVPQWRADTLQMVNWGGFHGVHRVTFAPGATLLSGASGTGKSTLMDAYIALMMPFDVPFNGASNDATGGRARSAGQRNVPSYLRGKLDDQVEAGTDEMHAQVLRGADTSTWGAVAMTFVSDTGRALTALRTYFLPRGGTVNADVGMKMATFDGFIDLADLADVVASRFDKRDLERRFPGIDVATSYTDFSTRLFTRLGIGSHGDGAKALRLLARIQAGHVVKTVDDLYKSMVLETPATFAAADRAVEHFTDLETAYAAMQDEALKFKELAGIPDRHAEMVKAQEAADLIDTFGTTRPGDTPFTLWAMRTEAALIEATVTENATARAKATEARDTAMRDESEYDALISGIEQAQDEAGGAMLRQIASDLERLQVDEDNAAEALRTFTRATEALEPDIADAAAFTAAQQAARAFLDTYDENEQKAVDAHRDLMRERYPISHELSELKSERESLSGRAGRMPREMHEARVAIAQAAGLTLDDVPFVAELIDVRPEDAKWRTAIETTLFGLARVMLIDERHLERVSRAIDPIHLPVRINFEGVPTREHAERAGDPDRISGKLHYKPSVFSHWVATRIASDRIDALCVDTVEQLAGRDRRVTVSGQMRHGMSGAHGRSSKTPNIIGFTNTDRIAEIDARRDELHEADARLAEQEAELGRRLRHLQDLRGAHLHILSATWHSIDVAGLQARAAALVARQQHILESSDQLGALTEQHKEMTAARDDARSLRYAAADALKGLNKAWEDLVDRADELSDELDRVGQAQAVILTDEQVAELDRQYVTHGNAGRLDLLPSDLERVKARLADQSREMRERARRACDALEATFARYDERWHDPSRGITVRSYDEYRDILDEITSRGLAKRQEEWTRRVAEWSGQDLVPLAGALATSIEDIEARLQPVNAILAELPFGARSHHLSIKLRRVHNDEVAKFAKDLRALSSGSTEALPDEQVLKRFKRLQAFIGQLRVPATGERAASKRDFLLDVRKHVEITAAALDDRGVVQATYASLGGKSGGETQELIAFIVGAALRYQLGDDGNDRPTFAPVLLDEAFIKADSEFAGRAVNAWKGLGFQLIVGAPLDKVTGLEPHMDKILSITKNPRGYSYVTDITPVRPVDEDALADAYSIGGDMP
jgi:uncharacterized protein YPO0396